MSSPLDLDARYGRTPANARRTKAIAFAAGAVALVVVVAWVAWVGLFAPAASLESRDSRFTIIDDASVSVSWDVSAIPGSTVSCAIQALNESFGIVGWKIVDLPASDQRTRSLTETVRTSEQAVTGLIYRCWLT